MLLSMVQVYRQHCSGDLEVYQSSNTAVLESPVLESLLRVQKVLQEYQYSSASTTAAVELL